MINIVSIFTPPIAAHVTFESGNYIDKNLGNDPVWQIENNEPIQFSMRWGGENNLHSNVLDLKQLRLNGWNGTDWISVGFDTLLGNINAGYLKTRVLAFVNLDFKPNPSLEVELSVE